MTVAETLADLAAIPTIPVAADRRTGRYTYAELDAWPLGVARVELTGWGRQTVKVDRIRRFSTWDGRPMIEVGYIVHGLYGTVWAVG